MTTHKNYSLPISLCSNIYSLDIRKRAKTYSLDIRMSHESYSLCVAYLDEVSILLASSIAFFT